MPASSQYVFECAVCAERGTKDAEGKPVVVRSHEPEATCPQCGTLLVVENWGKV